MQLGAGGGHPIAAAKLVYGEAGLSGMYAGLSAAITRQAVYTTFRVGLYDWLRVRRENGTERVTTRSGVHACVGACFACMGMWVGGWIGEREEAKKCVWGGGRGS